MNNLLGPNGKPIETSSKGHEDVLNLIARVQNLEALAIMQATILERVLYDDVDKHDINIFMEAFYQAQTKRGASHLSKSPTDDDPAIFI